MGEQEALSCFHGVSVDKHDFAWLQQFSISEPTERFEISSYFCDSLRKFCVSFVLKNKKMEEARGGGECTYRYTM